MNKRVFYIIKLGKTFDDLAKLGIFAKYGVSKSIISESGKQIDNILILFKPYIREVDYEEIYVYIRCGEEELGVNLLIFCLNQLKTFSYELGKTLEDFLGKYPPDGIYLRHEVCEKFMKRLKSAKIVFK